MRRQDEFPCETSFVPTDGCAARAAPLALVCERDELIEGLGYVWLEVVDLSRSLAFYRDGLKFAVGEVGGSGVPARLVAGRLQVVLSPSALAADCAERGVSLHVDVSGVDAYHDALVARGLEPTPPVDTGSDRSFSVRDPDGYEWHFHQSLA